MQTFFEGAVKALRRAVGVGGEQQGVPAAIYVRDIDAAVGADQAVGGLGDENTALAANNTPALLEGQLHDTSVQVVAAGPGTGSRRWLNAVE
jgi:hypothetical protein